MIDKLEEVKQRSFFDKRIYAVTLNKIKTKRRKGRWKD